MSEPVGSGQWPVADGAGDGPPAPSVVYALDGEHGLVAEGAVASYRDLRVWQEAMDLAEVVYALTRSFPGDERFGLTSQMRRAAVSIASNLAEGWGRGKTNEYAQFVRYARGSLKEIETQWLLAGRLGLLSATTLDDLEQRASRLGRGLLGLLRALDR